MQTLQRDFENESASSQAFMTLEQALSFSNTVMDVMEKLVARISGNEHAIASLRALKGQARTPRICKGENSSKSHVNCDKTAGFQIVQFKKWDTNYSLGRRAKCNQCGRELSRAYLPAHRRFYCPGQAVRESQQNGGRQFGVKQLRS